MPKSNSPLSRSLDLFLPATKTKRDRWIPITKGLLNVLEMRKHAPDGTEHGPDAYVFGTEVGDPRKDFSNHWGRICEAATITDLHFFHDLRREFASRLLESGVVPLLEASAGLGHADIQTTSIYLRTDASELDASGRSIGARRRAQGPASPVVLLKTARASERHRQLAVADDKSVRTQTERGFERRPTRVCAYPARDGNADVIASYSKETHVEPDIYHSVAHSSLLENWLRIGRPFPSEPRFSWGRLLR